MSEIKYDSKDWVIDRRSNQIVYDCVPHELQAALTNLLLTTNVLSYTQNGSGLAFGQRMQDTRQPQVPKCSDIPQNQEMSQDVQKSLTA